MMADDPVFADERAGGIQDDLRRRIVALLLDQGDLIASDAVATFSYAGSESLDVDYCRPVGRLLVQLLASAVRDTRIAPRVDLLADLHRLVIERSLPADQLYTF